MWKIKSKADIEAEVCKKYIESMDFNITMVAELLAFFDMDKKEKAKIAYGLDVLNRKVSKLSRIPVKKMRKKVKLDKVKRYVRGGVV